MDYRRLQLTGAIWMCDSSERELSYRPPEKVAWRYRAKKILESLLYLGTGIFVLWLVGPGLVNERSPGTEYWATIAAVGAALVIIVFLFVVTWNERLVRIENGRITWPFPFRKKTGVRTRYVLLSEIADAELGASLSGRRVAELTLLDGTRLVLPDRVFGEEGAEVLEALERHVKGRPIKDGGDVHGNP